MSPEQEVPVEERLQRLERRARIIQSRLLRAVDALDARRKQVKEVGAHAREVAKPTALALIGIASLFTMSAYAFSLAVRARQKLSVSRRASRAIRRLDLVRQPSLARRILDRFVFAVVTFFATELAKRVAKNFVDGRLPDGRLAVGSALDEHHRGMAHLLPGRPGGGE